MTAVLAQTSELKVIRGEVQSNVRAYNPILSVFPFALSL